MIIAYPLAFLYDLPQIFTRHFFSPKNIGIKINCIEYTTSYRVSQVINTIMG